MPETVFEFIERGPNPLPRLVTVERTQQSKYLFYALVRHYRKRLKPRPTFLTYNKAELENTKAAIEEHSLLSDEGDLLILEGFSQKFVEGLTPPRSTAILAETDAGELKAPPFSYKMKRDILRLLYQQLSLDYHKDGEGRSILTLRGLVKQDWSGFRSYEEFEPFLRRAKILGWSDEQLETELESTQGGNILTMVKKAQFKELFAMAERYGSTWMYGHLLEMLSELLHYRSLRTMGYDEQKCARELGAEIGYRKTKELEEANQMFSQSDLVSLTERVLNLDRLTIKNPGLGFAILCLNAPIRLKR